MKQVLILGARSFVAIPLVEQLLAREIQVTALSRQPEALTVLEAKGCKVLNLASLYQQKLEPDGLVSLMPIWETASLIAKLGLTKLKKAVVISSSSIMNKRESKWASDSVLVERLERAELSLQDFFRKQSIDLIILRPTMVFGYGKDQNISLILRNLKRFHVMPFLGEAKGLRQPIHADDLARAIGLSLEATVGSQTFELGGATQLSYRELVAEIARAYNIRYLPLTLPRALVLPLLNLLKLVPRYRFLELAMFERMNEDLLIDNHLLIQRTFFEPLSLREALKNDLKTYETI